MQRLKDITVRGSDEDVVRNLTTIAVKLAEFDRIVPTLPVDDFMGIAAKRLLAYQANELNAAALCLRIDLHAFAWRVRNIFEGFLLLEYTTKSAQNAKIFVAQKIADEITILEGVLSLDPTSQPDNTEITRRKDKATAVLAKHGINKASPWRVDFLAAQTNHSSEYGAFYKLYSKYVHPSAWTILSAADEYNNKDYWEVFIIQAQLYGHMSVGCAEAFLATRGKFQCKDA